MTFNSFNFSNWCNEQGGRFRKSDDRTEGGAFIETQTCRFSGTPEEHKAGRRTGQSSHRFVRHKRVENGEEYIEIRGRNKRVDLDLADDEVSLRDDGSVIAKDSFDRDTERIQVK